MTRLRPYVSDLLAGWSPDAPPTRELDGAFMFADVSGFTALSEGLEERGREGAELLNLTITAVLTEFIAAARRRGGDILAFGGDAILVHFDGPAPVERAAVAASEMQSSLVEPVEVPGLPPVLLAVSIGVHAGTAAALRVRAGAQTEALAVGPTITRTLQAEGAAQAGQILLTHDAADQVPTAWHHRNIAPGVLVGGIPPDGTEGGPAPDVSASTVPVEDLLAPDVGRVAGTLDADGQHRRVAVGFVRMARMDEVVAEQGLDAAHEYASDVVGVIAAHCDRTGVGILTLDSYPDAVKMLLCAGAPVATDDNEGALIEALYQSARELKGRDVHMGANRGLAFAGDLGAPTRRGYTLLGDTVNLAARLMQKAGPGELVASEAVVERTEAARTPLPPFKVKGKADDIVAFRVEAGDEQVQVVDLPIIGRAEEVALLDGLADQAAAGRMVAVDVIGAAGYGKSRLVREVANRHPELEPFVGRATAYGASTPYGLVRRLLRVLLKIPRQLPSREAGEWLTRLVETAAPELRGELPLIALAIDAAVTLTNSDMPADPAVVARRTARATSALLRAVRTRPMLIVIDDAQWVDDASRRILRRMALDSPDMPWLVIGVHRPDGTPLFDGLEGHVRLVLKPLEDGAAEQLVRAAAGERPLFDEDVTNVVGRAGGNCLFLVEYARSADDDVPDDVEALIARRLDALGTEDRQLLGVASVIGTTVSLHTVRSVSREADGLEPHDDHWTRLAGFLEPLRSGVVAWRDPVFREAAYAALPFQRRRELHQAVFHAIESSPSGGGLARSIALATHADLGGMAVEAWELLRKTGEAAAEDGASVDAVGLLTRALRHADILGEEVDSPALLHTLEVLARAADLSGRFSEGVSALEQALSLAHDDETRVHLLTQLGRLQTQLGEIDAARSAVDAAAETLHRTNGNADLRARVLVARGAIAYRTDDPEAGLRHASRVVGMNPSTVSPLVRARAFVIGDASVAAGAVGQEWAVGQGLQVFESLGDDYGVGNSHNNIGIVAYRDGDWGAAVEHWRRAVEAHGRAGSVSDAASSRMNIAEIRSDQGSWAEALEVLTASRNTWVAGGYGIGVAFVTSLIGRTLARSGQRDAAMEHLSEAEQSFRTVGATDLSREAALRAVEADWIAGDTDAARARIATVASDLEPDDPRLLLLRGAIAMSTDADEAHHLLGRAAASSEQTNRWFDSLMARVLSCSLHEVDPTMDDDVQALCGRLGVWRVAVAGGAIELGSPPAEITRD